MLADFPVSIDCGQALDHEALWAVQVPFSVSEPTPVGTVFDLHAVAVPDGRYNLTCQTLPGVEDEAYVLRLTFSPADAPQFHILKKGGDITADAVLRRAAVPAP